VSVGTDAGIVPQANHYVLMTSGAADFEMVIVMMMLNNNIITRGLVVEYLGLYISNLRKFNSHFTFNKNISLS
jgi:hypothetical protein